MQIYSSISELRKALLYHRNTKNTIGFVPTMGALHKGHLSLIEASKRENELTVCSIFVNPIQFNNASDLEKYPKVLEHDILMLESVACDILFHPSVTEMYPYGKPALQLDFGYQNTILEGKFRPGHFSGVGIVVAKLLNIVQPTRVYFGQKDFQQCLVVKQMVDEMSFPVDVVIIDIAREPNGLAMSSRNERLSPTERNKASIIFKCLVEASTELLKADFENIRRKIMANFRDQTIQLEYLEVLDYESGKLVEVIQKNKKYVICIAAFLNEVRLIDNVVVNT